MRNNSDRAISIIVVSLIVCLLVYVLRPRIQNLLGPFLPTPTVSPPTPTLTLTPPTRTPDQIGILVQVTNPFSYTERGGKIYQAIRFGIESQKETILGKDLAQKLVVIPFNDGADGKLAAQSVISYAMQSNIVCVLGANRSAVLSETLKIYDQEKLATFTVGASNMNLSDKQVYPNSVLRRVAGTNEKQAMGSANYISNKLKATKVYVIYVDTPYGQELAIEFTKEWKKLHGSEMKQNKFPLYNPQEPNLQLIKSLVANIPADTEVIYFAGYAAQAAPLFKAIYQKFNNVTFFASDGVDDDSMKDSSNATKNLYYVAIGAPIGMERIKKRWKNTERLKGDWDDWSKDQGLSGDLPPYLGESHDIATLCLSAIKEASHNGQTPNQDQVLEKVKSVTAVEDEKYMVGPYTYDENGNLREAVYFVRKANGAKWSENEIVDEWVQ